MGSLRRNREESELKALFRRRNLGILRVSAMVVVAVMPVFAIADYIFQIKYGVEIRNRFLYVDGGIFLYSVLVLMLSFLASRIYKQFITPAIFTFGYLVVASQVYLLYIRGAGQPYIFLTVLLVHSIIWHQGILRGIVYLICCCATTLPLMVSGKFSFGEIGAPTIVVSSAAVILIFFRHRFAKQGIEIRKKNSLLALSNRIISRDKETVQTALDKIRTLKHQQDGDYYLTSLLINPLRGDYVSHGAVNVETFTRQKKIFEFNKRTGELGGDLTALYKIMLRGKEYIAFVNSDAMGKSMQGAGGALVLGTVFKSIIERTRRSSRAQDRFPEQWMRQCYHELQSVFTSFDGSMLVSAIIGILDEPLGILYFINAEHPGVVSYKRGRAEFVGDDAMIAKIGMPEELHPRIHVLELEAEQVIVMGSDGRDDIHVSAPGGNNAPVMNADENLFLRCVEKGDGEINAIVRALETHGPFTDDISLVCIRYSPVSADDHGISKSLTGLRTEADQLLRRGKPTQAFRILEQILRMEPGNRPAITRYYRLGMKLEMYSQVAATCEAYLLDNPGHTEFFHYTCVAMKQAFIREGYGDLECAADYGEIYRLRKPDMIRNLINLADVYRLKGDTGRARALLSHAEHLDSQFPAVARLRAVFAGALVS